MMNITRDGTTYTPIATPIAYPPSVSPIQWAPKYTLANMVGSGRRKNRYFPVSEYSTPPITAA